MITKKQKINLKSFIGNNYAKEVLDILNKKNILSRNNQPYSESFVRMVFNGYRENLDIEDAIFLLYKNRKRNYRVREEAKEQLLSA